MPDACMIMHELLCRQVASCMQCNIMHETCMNMQGFFPWARYERGGEAEDVKPYQRRMEDGAGSRAGKLQIRPDVVRELLEHGAYLSQATTSLHVAAENRHTRSISLPHLNGRKVLSPQGKRSPSRSGTLSIR